MRRLLGAFTCSLLVLAGLVGLSAAPASAAGGLVVANDPDYAGVYDVDASSVTYLGLGYDTYTWNVDTVVFEQSGPVASVPDECAIGDTDGTGITGYVYCPADGVSGVIAMFGPSADRFDASDLCTTVIAAVMGGGDDEFDGPGCGTGTQLVVDAGAGNDSVNWSGSAAGQVDLGDGDDRIYVSGADGTLKLTGGAGDDDIRIGSGKVQVDAGAGVDRIAIGNGSGKINAGSGNDEVDASSGTAMGGYDIKGGAGQDTFEIYLPDRTHSRSLKLSLDNKANDTFGGKAANIHDDFEIIYGSPWADRIVAGKKKVTISGNEGDDVIIGGPGKDLLYGDSDSDVIKGGAGNDKIFGGSEGDRIDGGAGKDQIYGDSSTCCVSNGGDIINSVDGSRDQINCGGGPDILTRDPRDVYSQDGQQQCEQVKTKK